MTIRVKNGFPAKSKPWNSYRNNFPIRDGLTVRSQYYRPFGAWAVLGPNFQGLTPLAID